MTVCNILLVRPSWFLCSDWYFFAFCVGYLSDQKLVLGVGDFGSRRMEMSTAGLCWFVFARGLLQIATPNLLTVRLSCIACDTLVMPLGESCLHHISHARGKCFPYISCTLLTGAYVIQFLKAFSFNVLAKFLPIKCIIFAPVYLTRYDLRRRMCTWHLRSTL